MKDVPQAGPGACAGALCYPTDLTLDSAGNLWVVDGDNNRVLRYSAPLVNDQSPDLVIGQPDFTTSTWGRTATNFNLPWGLAFDSSGNLWITDAINLRVLRFSPPFSNGQAANLVLGQKDFTSFNNADTDGAVKQRTRSCSMRTAICTKWTAWFRRVMVFSPPFKSGMPAAVALIPSPSGFGDPTGVFIGH